MNRRAFFRFAAAGIAGLALSPKLVIDWTPRETKLQLIARLLQNGLDAMDDMLERALFAPGHSARALPDVFGRSPHFPTRDYYANGPVLAQNL